MVTIITGKINGGKTGRIFEIYLGTENGDGFATPKVLRDGETAGYDIQRLSTGEAIPFIRRKDGLPEGWDEAFSYCDYSFSQKGLRFAESTVDTAIAEGRNPIFIDEIGPIELEGKGFAELLERTLESNKDLYICVRESCVEDVVKKFNIREFALITV